MAENYEPPAAAVFRALIDNLVLRPGYIVPGVRELGGQYFAHQQVLTWLAAISIVAVSE